MKRVLFILAVCLLTTATEARNLKALFDYKTFYAPGQGPYLEWYLSINGSSVTYQPTKNDGFQASVAITYIIKSQDKIIRADKYNLLSPLLKDTMFVSDFMDVKRIPLTEGSYALEISVTDNQGGNEYNLKQNININLNAEKVSASDIELIQDYMKTDKQSDMLVKNGYSVTPRVDNFYNTGDNNLKFYTEVYNTQKLTDDAVVLAFFIQKLEDGSVLSDFGMVQRKNVSEVIPVLSEINISNLPSGNYELVAEVKDKSNNTLANSKVYFQRHNSATEVPVYAGDVSKTFVGSMSDKNVLAEYIACLRPIAGPQQSEWITNQMKASDIEMMKNFFYDFWQQQNPADPEGAWKTYKEKVDMIQRKYGTRAFKGYNTDMGRVYLQYGPPSSINKGEFEPNTYPYEMWHYDKIKNQTNKMFVFYSKDLLSRNYTLLHSDMPGEPNEPAWNIILRQKSAVTSKDIDDTGKDLKGIYSGDRTNDNYNDK
ncbi:MAG: GWxTD domain-containing protein [Bacteroidetes bacterium]|jgi:GWxTD domain-containing protein|nr:GWxTD domain-containing protein [Bacteroidota bacterium]